MTTDKPILSEHQTSSKIYKLCTDNAFGRRLRGLSERSKVLGDGWKSPYTAGEITPDSGLSAWTFRIRSSLYPDAVFDLRLEVLKANGSLRLRFDERESVTGNKRYAEVAQVTLIEQPMPEAIENVTYTTEENRTVISLWDGQSVELQHAPFFFTVKRQDGTEALRFNERGLFHLEHYRSPEDLQPESAKWFEGELDSSSWEETFREHTFTYNKGPEGFSFDVSFPGSQHVYGLAEHAAPLSLPSTDGSHFSEPYRLYNIDYVRYPASSSTGLYGNVPLLQSHSADSSIAVLAMMGSESNVDVSHPPSGVQTHWFGESGVVDLFILLGPTPDSLFEQYASLTGTTPLPPLFSIGHHQCRWNYDSQEDVLSVTANFDKAGIPLDVIWLDIEWAKDHRYFEWDYENFPDPKGMLSQLESEGRKLVVIVDPHLQASETYSIMKAAEELDVLIKTPDGSKPYIGHCWPGASGWVDYNHPATSEWWQSLFLYDHFKDSSSNLWLWNDMNEPAIFEGPEKTLPKECLHYGRIEHRDVHNLYGMLMQKATFSGLTKRDSPSERPFVLSRSFFAGSQRYGAIWTGDNIGSWDHLAGQTAMLLNCCVSGINFIGADVGGFFGDPDPEMLVRWYQAGAFMPFFRAHANIKTKRREPYLFDKKYQTLIKQAIQLRYRLLPVWYTAFRQTSASGAPLMRPQYVEYPKDEAGYAIGTQYHIGKSGLLFHPVVAPGAVTADVYLAPGQPHVDFHTGRTYPALKVGATVSIPSPLDHSVVLLRGGSIIGIHDNIQRSSQDALSLDLTLYIALGIDGTAKGEVYIDDGESMAYQQGSFVHRQFTFENGKLTNSDASSGMAKGNNGAFVTKVIVWGSEGSDGSDPLDRTGLKLAVDQDWTTDL